MGSLQSLDRIASADSTFAFIDGHEGRSSPSLASSANHLRYYPLSCIAGIA
jgi:hypothetical protein